jgi:hypothetical protein
MTRPSDDIGRDWHDDSGDPAHSSALYVADVTSVDSPYATVIVRGFNGKQDYTGVPFMPRDSVDVSPGDRAWVGFDDERDPVIVCWVPA